MLRFVERRFCLIFGVLLLLVIVGVLSKLVLTGVGIMMCVEVC